MNNVITDAKSEQTLSCVSPNCTYHVHFKPKKPLPGFGQVASLETNRTVYLTCDNPATPHTNPYLIQF